MTHEGWLKLKRDELAEKSRTGQKTDMLLCVEEALAYLNAERDRRRRREMVQQILHAELNAHMIPAALYTRIMDEL